MFYWNNEENMVTNIDKIRVLCIMNIRVSDRRTYVFSELSVSVKIRKVEGNGRMFIAFLN